MKKPKPLHPKQKWRMKVYAKLGDSMYGGALRVTRDVTMKECDWLDFDFKEGDIVYGFGASMGTVSVNGWAVTVEPNEHPFYELPLDALEAVEFSDKTLDAGLSKFE